MSNTAELTASPLSAQTVVGTATFTDGTNPVTPDGGAYNFTIEDISVAVVLSVDGNAATIKAVADPTGPSVRTVNLSCVANFGGQSVLAAPGPITVTTIAPGVVGSIDFGPPQG